jgi:hypothetical protein
LRHHDGVDETNLAIPRHGKMREPENASRICAYLIPLMTSGVLRQPKEDFFATLPIGFSNMIISNDGNMATMLGYSGSKAIRVRGRRCS